MADKRKVRYRGRTYMVDSVRTGKKRVHVKGYCRRKPKTWAERWLAHEKQRSETPF